MDGVITNRVSVDKAIIVQSVNGPKVTIIQGAWDPTSTNGPGAVRCAWLTNERDFIWFHVARRRKSTSGYAGGVFASYTGNSPIATAANCVITRNAAGGAYGVRLNNCIVASNRSERRNPLFTKKLCRYGKCLDQHWWRSCQLLLAELCGDQKRGAFLRWRRIHEHTH